MPNHSGLAGVQQFLNNRPSAAEFDALKAEVVALKELLAKAVEYDKKTGQPQCETASKVALIQAVAKAVGVDMGDIFKEHK